MVQKCYGKIYRNYDLHLRKIRKKSKQRNNDFHCNPVFALLCPYTFISLILNTFTYICAINDECRLD